MKETKAVMTSRQAAELDHAFERNGFTPELVKKLSKGNTLGSVLEVLLGHAEIKQVEYLVDLDADPFVPEYWNVEEHKKGGKFKYDPMKMGLYLSKNQKKGDVIASDELRKELKNQPVMNANMLDFLLKNTHLIPESWKGEYVFFWGTVYSHSSDGRLCFRHLYWADDKWSWAETEFDYRFGALDPAAVFTR